MKLRGYLLSLTDMPSSVSPNLSEFSDTNEICLKLQSSQLADIFRHYL